MDRLKKIWADPVWSKVISVGILGLIGVVYTSIQGLWPTIIQWVFSETKIPNWLLLTLCIFTTLFIVKIGRTILYRIKPKKEENKQTQELYNQDLIFDILWHWTNVNGRILGLIPCCPKCNYELSHKSRFIGLGPDIVFNCDHCNCVVAEFRERVEDIYDRVYKEIERKLRTNNLPARKPPKMKLPSYGTKWPS